MIRIFKNFFLLIFFYGTKGGKIRTNWQSDTKDHVHCKHQEWQFTITLLSWPPALSSCCLINNSIKPLCLAFIPGGWKGVKLSSGLKKKTWFIQNHTVKDAKGLSLRVVMIFKCVPHFRSERLEWGPYSCFLEIIDFGIDQRWERTGGGDGALQQGPSQFPQALSL